MSNWTIDTDKIKDILKSDAPISLGAFEENGKDKILVLFALPELHGELIQFVNKLLAEHKEKGADNVER